MSKKTKNRRGYDLSDWFRDNPKKTMADLRANPELFFDPQVGPPDNPFCAEIGGTNISFRVENLTKEFLDKKEKELKRKQKKPETKPEPPKKKTENQDKIRKEKLSALWDMLDKTKETKNNPPKVKLIASNCETILTHHPDWEKKFVYNERKMFRYIEPGTPVTKDAKKRTQITDTTYTRIKYWLEREYGLAFSESRIASDLATICENNAFDPVRDYFDSLKWDMSPRLNDWLHVYARTEKTEYATSIGKAWLISAVARTYDPGCKVDTMLILKGAQGVRKSTLFETLASPEFFLDDLGDIQNKDCKQLLQGPLIIEVAELANLTRKEVETTKGFLSRRTDTFRPPYGTVPIERPRRVIFGGTTNEDEFLKDPTGERRSWPIEVGNIDVERLKKERDQLWAEAVEMYKLGFNWWLSNDMEQQAKVYQEMFSMKDSWHDDVLTYCLASRTDMTVNEKYWNMFGLDSKRTHISICEVEDALSEKIRFDKWAPNRIRKVFTALGFVRDKRKRVAGKQTTLYKIPEGFHERNNIDEDEETLELNYG